MSRIYKANSSSLPLKQLGNTNLSVTAVGFGTSPLAGMPGSYGYDVDQDRAAATLDAILDSPINFLDTSRNYGWGRAEERINQAFKRRGGPPEGLILSTKLDRHEETDCFDAAQARRSLEQSLTALDLDRVDVLHLHDPEWAASLDEIVGPNGAMEELFKMKEEGLASAVGLAMGRVELMFELLKQWPFDVLINHNRFSLLNRQADEMYDYAYENGIGIINAAPYAGGALAKVGSGEQLRVTYQQADEEALAPVRAVQAVCERHKVAVGAAALQFSMRDPRISTTLVGVSRPERVAQTVEWATASTSDELWDQLAALPYETSDPEATRSYPVD